MPHFLQTSELVWTISPHKLRPSGHEFTEEYQRFCKCALKYQGLCLLTVVYNIMCSIYNGTTSREVIGKQAKLYTDQGLHIPRRNVRKFRSLLPSVKGRINSRGSPLRTMLLITRSGVSDLLLCQAQQASKQWLEGCETNGIPPPPMPLCSYECENNKEKKGWGDARGRVEKMMSGGR